MPLDAIRKLNLDYLLLAREMDKDFTVLYGYTVSGDSLEYVLQKTLASYGLKATLYSINRVIVIQSLNEPRTVG